MDPISTVGIVSNKFFWPAHMAQGSTGNIYTVADSRALDVNIDGTEVRMYPGLKDYDTIKIGDKLNIVYKKTRIFSRIEILDCHP